MRGKTVPEGFSTVTPYLLVDGVPALINFLQSAFDAEEIMRSTLGDGTVNHAQVKIGDSMVMMGQAQKEYPAMPAMLYLYVDDVDGVYAQALAAGGKALREPTDQEYGDRAAGVRGPSGNHILAGNSARPAVMRQAGMLRVSNYGNLYIPILSNS